MRLLKRRDPTTHKEVNGLFDVIERTPDFGYELRDEWAGCMAVHCGRDRYRVIWEQLEPVEDLEGIADEVIPVVILTVGPKTNTAGRTIYETGRP